MTERSYVRRLRRSTSGIVVSVVMALLLTVPAGAAGLDLSGCVRRALVRNFDVETARDGIEAAKLGRELALAEYRLDAIPTVRGGFEGSNRTNQEYGLTFRRKFLPTGTEVVATSGTRSFSTVPEVTVPVFSESRLTVSQPLWQGRTRLETHADIDDAERRIASSVNGLAAAEERLVLDVVRAYYTLVEAEELVRIGVESTSRLEALVPMAEARLERGTVSRMDVYRAELNAARSAQVLLDLEGRATRSLDALKLLLGLSPETALEVETAFGGPRLDSPDVADLESAALERRPEVAEVREAIVDAERRVVLARYRSWPAIDLVGSYARQGLGDSFEESFDLDREEWTVGLRSTISLERTEEHVAMREAELRLRAEERRLRRVRAEVLGQVREAARELDRTAADLELSRRTYEHAEQQVELARFRYDRGVTDNFDLVQAEIDLSRARGEILTARVRRVLAVTTLLHAAGSLRDAFPEAAREGSGA